MNTAFVVVVVFVGCRRVPVSVRVPVSQTPGETFRRHLWWAHTPFGRRRVLVVAERVRHVVHRVGLGKGRVVERGKSFERQQRAASSSTPHQYSR
jgi:hypothetical protein